MSLTAFIFAVLTLLIAPGPTNTLMGVAGAQGGPRRVLRLIPAELAGYLTTILPLVFVGAELLARQPAAAAALKVVAAGWVMYLAVKLWRIDPAGGSAGTITARKIGITTMLNPKALIFGLVLLPAPDAADFPIKLGLFCAMVTGVAMLWGTAGAAVQTAGGAHRLRLVQRIASVWLAVVSVSLIAAVVRI